METRIDRDELRGKISRGDRFVLIESLPSFMYDQGHLPGAQISDASSQQIRLVAGHTCKLANPAEHPPKRRAGGAGRARSPTGGSSGSTGREEKGA